MEKTAVVERYILMQALDRKLTDSDLRRIAKELGVSVRTVRASANALVEDGLLAKLRTKRNRWVYVLV